jgi:hypothetical protein
MAAESWKERKETYARKFAVGRRYIPDLFAFAHGKTQQIVVLGTPRSTKEKNPLGENIEIIFMPDLIHRMKEHLQGRKVESGAVPSQYPLIRAIQFALDYGGFLKD